MNSGRCCRQAPPNGCCVPKEGSSKAWLDLNRIENVERGQRIYDSFKSSKKHGNGYVDPLPSNMSSYRQARQERLQNARKQRHSDLGSGQLSVGHLVDTLRDLSLNNCCSSEERVSECGSSSHCNNVNRNNQHRHDERSSMMRQHHDKTVTANNKCYTVPVTALATQPNNMQSQAAHHHPLFLAPDQLQPNNFILQPTPVAPAGGGHPSGSVYGLYNVSSAPLSRNSQCCNCIRQNAADTFAAANQPSHSVFGQAQFGHKCFRCGVVNVL